MKKTFELDISDDLFDGNAETTINAVKTADSVTIPRAEYDEIQRKATLLDMCATLLETGQHTNEYAATDMIRMVYGIADDSE